MSLCSTSPTSTSTPRGGAACGDFEQPPTTNRVRLSTHTAAPLICLRVFIAVWFSSSHKVEKQMKFHSHVIEKNRGERRNGDLRWALTGIDGHESGESETASAGERRDVATALRLEPRVIRSAGVVVCLEENSELRAEYRCVLEMARAA